MTITATETQLPTNKRSRLAAAIWSSLQFAGSFTDLIIHENEPIRIKSAKGLIGLRDLGVPGGDLTPDLADIQQFFASYLDESDPYDSAHTYWDKTVLPVFQQMRAVNRSLKPQTSGNQYLRFSIMQHLGGKVAMVVRITTEPPAMETIGLHQSVAARLRDNPKGLLIITGPTASGKTSTALSILKYLNQNSSGHIVTVEDPVEYPMKNKHCVFTQRQVGTDVASFGEGLRDAMRMTPDAILAGEVRDKDTAEAAVLGGESGALMIVTTHGRSVTGALRKILALAGDAAMRSILSGSMIGVIRQELLPRKDGTGYRMVNDTLLATEQTRKLIDEGNWGGLDAIAARDDANFNSMRPAVDQLVRENIVDRAVAAQVVGMRKTGLH
jgi:twitching motility protein PilT